jgi:hypothetical protein
VKPFPNSSTRPEILEKYGLFRQLIQRLVPSIQWVDGSFVEDKENPGDVDVVVWVADSDLNSLSVAKQAELHELFYGERKAEYTFKTDAYLISTYGEEHPQFFLYKKSYDYWSRWFSHARCKRLKGLVRLQVPLVPPRGANFI